MFKRAATVLFGLILGISASGARAATPDPAFAKESGECAVIMLKLWEVTEDAKQKQSYYSLSEIMVNAAVGAGASREQMMGFQTAVEDGIKSQGTAYLGQKIDTCKSFLDANQQKLVLYSGG
ncbi:hypothetical protein [Arenimonas sp. GDDSR-1]|uniref:hypothetical protein n=1 Tax=Arenimonas sp. GDDSR-1 TaxID=2950125 RepID=UPI0026058DD8|nr:hypothetical protein [Arenimonas sp. GDDSR-1]